MLADPEILNFPKVSLEMKDLLPECSGIYYVVDQNNVIIYIGQAKNLKKRWQGNSHHRINQLKATRKREFHLYYEKVSESQLDQIEKSLIQKYQPELNDSLVTNQKIYFVELLLQETLRKLDKYVAVLGVSQKIKLIYLVFDYKQFRIDFNIDVNTVAPILNQVFVTRKKTAVKWKMLVPKHYGFMFCDLPVNGYNVHLVTLEYFGSQKYTSINQFKCHSVSFAEESVPCISLQDLNHIKMEKEKESLIQSLSTYTEGLLPYLSQDNQIPSKEELQNKLRQVCHEYKAGQRGVGSKVKTRSSSLKSISALLQNKNPLKTTVSTVYYKSSEQSLYVRCFCLDDVEKNSLNCLGHGKSGISHVVNFKDIYLLSGCKHELWELLKDYLSDFVMLAIDPNDASFPKDTCYVKKLFISQRRYIKPARFSIKFKGVQSSFSMPFGRDNDDLFTTFVDAKKEITRRLKSSDLPEFKLTFAKESIQTKGRSRYK